jgi:shikimate kinase
MHARPRIGETAHYVIETGRPSVATLVNTIVMQLELGAAAAVPDSAACPAR